MNVNQYSYHVKPILNVEEMDGIVIASKGKLYHANLYSSQANECICQEGDECIQFNLSDPIVDGWCYMKDLYPTKTTI